MSYTAGTTPYWMWSIGTGGNGDSYVTAGGASGNTGQDQTFTLSGGIVAVPEADQMAAGVLVMLGAGAYGLRRQFKIHSA